MIHVASGKMEYARSGTGGPAVILINGGGGPIEGWHRIFREVAEATTVVAYNRLGVGGSDKPSAPQHGEAIVNALRQLLQETNIHPPYMLVGHSLGGLYANLYARLYPNEIASVVLLESSHPLDLRINETQGPLIRGMNRILGMFDSFTPWRKWSEVNYVEETVAQIEQAGSFPDVPLVVVSGSMKPPMMPAHVMEIRKKNQSDLLRLSKHSKPISASRSGHFPQLTDPELVIHSVLDCIHAARNNQE
jgi:pimeloyl-ACP methyl ester carboxylesterase